MTVSGVFRTKKLHVVLSVAWLFIVRFQNIDELVDTRVLCALVNSFIPNTFATEVLLNDRWTINLVLRTFEKMFFLGSPFDSEDLAEVRVIFLFPPNPLTLLLHTFNLTVILVHVYLFCRLTRRRCARTFASFSWLLSSTDSRMRCLSGW